MHLNVKTDSWLSRWEEVEEIRISTANTIDYRIIETRVRAW